jgi:hypothetical protein
MNDPQQTVVTIHNPASEQAAAVAILKSSGTACGAEQIVELPLSECRLYVLGTQARQISGANACSFQMTGPNGSGGGSERGGFGLGGVAT